MNTVPELPILMQGEDWLVVNKPVGMFVHRSGLDRHDEGPFALQILRVQTGAWVYPVHRLDRPTSGALLFAKTSEAARELGAQFAAHTIDKSYLAVVRGIPTLSSFSIDYPLRVRWERAAQAGDRVQEALTRVELLASVELPVMVDRYPTSRYSLVRAYPVTGRAHQIRRHLRHVGHPLIGDVTHGVGKHNRFFAEKFGTRRLLLACESLRFRPPGRTESVCVRAPLSDEFLSVLRNLGWESVLAPT